MSRRGGLGPVTRKRVPAIEPIQVAWSQQNAVNAADTTHPTGTVTFTAPKPGVYRVTLNSKHITNNVFTLARSAWNIGGTSTRLDTLSTGSSSAPTSGAADVDVDTSASQVLLFRAIAGQTITLVPIYRTDFAAGTPAWIFDHFIEHVASY